MSTPVSMGTYLSGRSESLEDISTGIAYKLTTGEWKLKTVHTQPMLDEVHESSFVKDVVIISVKGKKVVSQEDLKRIIKECQ